MKGLVKSELIDVFSSSLLKGSTTTILVHDSDGNTQGQIIVDADIVVQIVELYKAQIDKERLANIEYINRLYEPMNLSAF